MHYLIQIIVEVEDGDQANSEADTIMSDLVNKGDFDWYHAKDSESRWPECWQPVRLSKEKAKASLKETMNELFIEFQQTMKTIRGMLKDYSDEQIFNEMGGDAPSKHYLSRYHFARACGHVGPRLLYDKYGNAIINQQELNWYLENPEKYWLVQVDGHS